MRTNPLQLKSAQNRSAQPKTTSSDMFRDYGYADKAVRNIASDTYASETIRLTRPVDTGFSLKGVIVTFGFLVFCTLSALACWYLLILLRNGSYRAAAVFITLIIVSNVTSKYLIWNIKS